MSDPLIYPIAIGPVRYDSRVVIEGGWVRACAEGEAGNGTAVEPSSGWVGRQFYADGSNARVLRDPPADDAEPSA